MQDPGDFNVGDFEGGWLIHLRTLQSWSLLMRDILRQL